MILSEKIPKKIYSLLLLGFLGIPDVAWALQSHASPEGIYVHQLAHIFFVAALCHLFWDIKRSSFDSKGWRYLLAFCIFMILWNIVAFTGHWAEKYLDAHVILRENGYFSSKITGPLTSSKLIYYFAKMDHIFSVPALFCLYLCMRTLYRDSCSEEEHD